MGLALVVAVALFRAWICERQLRHLSTAAEASGYAAAVVHLRLILALLQGVAGVAVLAWLRTQPLRTPGEFTLTVFGIVCLQTSIDLAVSAVKSFMVDRSFGSNRATPQLFVRDAVQSLALRGGIALTLTALALILMLLVRDWWPLFFALLAMGLSALSAALYRRWIEPLQRHFTAVPSGSPGQGMRDCLRRCGFERAELVIEPGSMRSTHANARAELLGRRGRVVLLDTLLWRLPPEQVEAALAHELGHLAGRHLQRRFGWLCLIWTCVFAAAVTIATGGAASGGWNQWAAVPVLLWPLRFLLQPWMNRLLRRWEFEADAFAARHVPPAALGNALQNLFRVNAAALRSDPWFAAFYESHPPLAQRLARLPAT